MPLDSVALTFPDSGAKGFLVHDYESTDAVNELFEIRLEVSNTDAELDVTTVVGETVEIALAGERFIKQRKGIVRRARQLTSEPAGTSLFELIVVPPLWLTTRRRDCRIFQNKGCETICEEVLALYGGRIPAPKFSGVALPKREYRVQYDETDHDFLFRIFAEEGVATLFDDETDGSFCLLNGLGMFNVIRSADIPFIPPAGAGAKQTKAHVLSVAITSDIQTSKATVRDYDFKNPKYKLEKKAKDPEEELFSKEKDLEQYEFVNNKFTTAKEKAGEQLAQQHLNEARATRRTFECKTNFHLPAGSAFTIAGHPRADVNIELRILRSHMRVVDEGGAAHTEYTLFCIPADTSYSPPRRPKPRIYGTHVATVIGETDGPADIDIDKFGRVKIEFHWDRRDLHLGNPTRFVRVSQGWAGSGFGMVLHPRVGHEVIVAYLDGDPDEPIIIGRLHNEHNVSPLPLPADKTKSIWRSQTSPGGDGHNQIMMEDKQGKELLEFHAQRDNLFHVNAQQDIFVGAKRNDHVKSDVDEKYDTKQTITIGGGGKFLTIGGTGHTERITGKWDTQVSGVWKSVTSDWSHKSPGVTWEIENNVWITVPDFKLLSNALAEFHTAIFVVYDNSETTFNAKKFVVQGNSLSKFDTREFVVNASSTASVFGNSSVTVRSTSLITLDAPEVKNTSTKWYKYGVASAEALVFKESVGVQKLDFWASATAVSGLKIDLYGSKVDNSTIKAIQNPTRLQTLGTWIASGAIRVASFGFAKL